MVGISACTSSSVRDSDASSDGAINVNADGSIADPESDGSAQDPDASVPTPDTHNGQPIEDPIPPPDRIIYVDNQLNSNCEGGYSIQNHDCSGQDGDAYTSVQAAVTVIEPGEAIHMRGGKYAEHIRIPGHKQGNDQKWFHLTSYPGEWAVLDPGHDVEGDNFSGYVILYHDGSHSSCPSYWRFSRFEVTGGGITTNESGGGIRLDTAHHIQFEYLYVHDNIGKNGSNNGGIVIPNDTQAPQYISVKHCYFKDNGCGGINCGNVSLFSDYTYNDLTSTNNIGNTRHGNEIAYNLIEGSANGIKHKAEQYMTYYDKPDVMEHKLKGDKIHHNIVRGYGKTGIIARQDFIQVYNNIVTSDVAGTKHGIDFGSATYDKDRDFFYNYCYNNHIIGQNVYFMHDWTPAKKTSAGYVGDLQPHVRFYNNIFENTGSGNSMLRIFSFYTAEYSPYRTINDIDMNTVHVENNLFYNYSSSDDVIKVARDTFSANAYASAGYAQTIYSSDTSGLRSDYSIDGSFDIGNGKTIANGGINEPHDYLPGVNIPGYVGAMDPNDHAWVQRVLQLKDKTTMVK